MEKAITFLQILLYIYLIYIFMSFCSKTGKSTRRMESNVGKTIILKDTLTITDYSIFGQCYYLSNGSRIFNELAEQKLKN